MERLNQIELKNISGGGIGIGLLIGLGAFITFVIGVVDGYVRPLRCNK